MFKINRRVEYALIALMHMRRVSRGAVVSARVICDTYRTPFDPTSRVLQLMAQSGILKVVQGAYGGYQIDKDLSKISLLDLTRIVKVPIALSNCMRSSSRHRCPSAPTCTITGAIEHLQRNITDVLRSIPLATIIDNEYSKKAGTAVR